MFIMNMRKFLFLILTLLITFTSSAQRIDSLKNAPPPRRKESLRDLPWKIMKVVLAEDNTMLDLLIKNAVEKGWYISPYEFCSLEKFEQEKCDSNFYFLTRVSAIHKKETEYNMSFLSLRKGSPKAVDDINEMPEILSLPLCPTEDKEGKVFSFLPAYIRIFQAHIQSIIDNNANAYLGMTMYNDVLERVEIDKMLFAEGDFVFPLTQIKLNSDFCGKASLVSFESIEDALSEKTEGTAVSLVLAPNHIERGSICYTMLICTDTYQLVYYKKHKMNKRKGAGFLKSDYKKICAPFRPKK